jgi:ComF family protein
MIAGISRAIAATIFPARCQTCRTLFHPPDAAGERMPPDRHMMQQADLSTLFKKEMTPWLCTECLDRFTPMERSCCPACGRIFRTVDHPDHACGGCTASAKTGQTVMSVRSAGLLEGALMDAIHALKYDGKIQLARPLGRILLAALMREFIPEQIDVIVPVPLHRARLRQRGFNQVLLMLREWPDFPLVRQAGIVIEPRIIVRTVNTVSQTGLGRGKRKANVRGAFAVASPDRIKDRRVVVIDDVFTTGATSTECARMLVRAGAATVSVLTLAHAG